MLKWQEYQALLKSKYIGGSMPKSNLKVIGELMLKAGEQKKMPPITKTEVSDQLELDFCYRHETEFDLDPEQEETILNILHRIIWFRLKPRSQSKKKKDWTPKEKIAKFRFDHFVTPFGIPESVQADLKKFCKKLGWEIIELTARSMRVKEILPTLETT